MFNLFGRPTQEKVIKTGIDFLDEAQAVVRGKATFLTGGAASGKTRTCLQIAINIAVNGDKKVLYITDKKSMLKTQLQFLELLSFQQGKELCSGVVKDLGLEDIDNIHFDPIRINTLYMIARAIEDCNVRFVSLDDFDEDSFCSLMTLYDFDLIIIDSAFDLNPDTMKQVEADTLFEEFSTIIDPSAWVFTYPLAYSEMKDKYSVSLEDVENTYTGEALIENADHIIGLNIPRDPMNDDDSSKYVFLK